MVELGYAGMCEPILMDSFWHFLVWWRGPTHKCLSAERSSHLNVETEPHESPMCSFTLHGVI